MSDSFTTAPRAATICPPYPAVARVGSRRIEDRFHMCEKDKTVATLRDALPDLRRRWPIHSLALFGSMARGEANAASDLDILIEFAQPIRLTSFLALEQELRALTGRRIDLVSAQR